MFVDITVYIYICVFITENEMGILRTGRCVVRTMCGVQLRDRKRDKDLMLMLYMNESMNQMSMANCVYLYGIVLRRGDGHVLRILLDVMVRVQKSLYEASGVGMHHG